MTQIIASSGIECNGSFWQRFFRSLQTPNVIYSKFFWILVGIKASFTFFAFYIYSRFTPFLDAAIYLSPLSSDNRVGIPRTERAHVLFGVLREALYSDLAVHLLTSVALAYVIWVVFRRVYEFINKPLFYSALLLPHFMIWTGMVGKEPLAIAGFLLFIRVSVDVAMKQSLQIIPLIFGLVLVSFRPQYFIPYGYLWVVSLFLTHFRIKRLDLPKNSALVFVFSFILAASFMFAVWGYLDPYISGLMQGINDMFLAQTGHTGANRLDIQWKEPIDVINNVGWGLPFSIIGPTLREVLARPLILPAFLEGVFSLGLLLLVVVKIINYAFNNPKYNAFIILGLIPAIVIGLLVNYPVGLFNPGSAIRYKQSLAPLFYFYAILLMGEVNRKKCLEDQAVFR